MSKTKKISTISAIFITLGCTIGAGIFIKNDNLLELTQGKVSMIIIAWIIGGIGVISLGIAIFEINSVAKNNRGVSEWTKKFCPKWLHKGGMGYMGIIYYPTHLIALPLLLVRQMQETGGFTLNGWYVGLIAMSIAIWTLVLSGFSLKFAEKSQWVITLIKFIPLLILPIMAFIHQGGPAKLVNYKPTGFSGSSIYLGIIATVPTIAFTFNGFQQSTAIKTDLKHPNSGPKIMISAIAVLVLIYTFFSVSFLFGTKNGNYEGLGLPYSVLTFFRICICIAIYGIINGYAMASPNFYEASWEEKDYVKPFFLKKFVKKRESGTIYSILLTIPFYLVLIPIGIYGFKDSTQATQFGSSAAGLYLMNKTFSSWISLLVFVLIVCAVVGAMINRKTNKVKGIEKQKLFLTASVIATIYFGTGFIFSFIEQIVNATGFNGANQMNAIYQLLILCFTILICFSPLIIEVTRKRWNNKKYN